MTTAGCGCQYDASGRPFVDRCVCTKPTPPGPDAVERLAAWLYAEHGGQLDDGDWVHPPWMEVDDATRAEWIDEARHGIAVMGDAPIPAGPPSIDSLVSEMVAKILMGQRLLPWPELPQDLAYIAANIDGAVGPNWPTGRRIYVTKEEWDNLHRVAVHARDAVRIAEAAGIHPAGIHLGPLRAALERTVYRPR